MNPTYRALQRDIAELMDRLSAGEGGRDEGARTSLLSRALSYQREHVAPYARLCSKRAGDHHVAVPTDVFRFARVACHPPELDARTFLTSGTTSGQRGAHHLHDLSLYDVAAKHAARHALFPDRKRLRLLILAPTARDAPESSLSYMLGRFVDWFGTDESRHLWTAEGPDVDGLRAALAESVAARTPVALLGTSFALVHAEDTLGGARFELPQGSRIMQTGGFKGRSRTLDAPEMLLALSTRYGVPEPLIIQEYGMTELCSQGYESTLRDALLGQPIAPRHLWMPGWVHAQPVDPEHLRPVRAGEPGLLRIEDLANLDSVCAIQTADLSVRDDSGLRLLGRAPDAVARGCSLAVEEALGQAAPAPAPERGS